MIIRTIATKLRKNEKVKKTRDERKEEKKEEKKQHSALNIALYETMNANLGRCRIRSRAVGDEL